MINISKLKKANVLKVLYNNSKPLGMGFLHYDPKPMTTEEAEELLEQTLYFDYLKGRVMKIDLSSDEEFNERLYDRDNGTGAAQRAIDSIDKEELKLNEEDRAKVVTNYYKASNALREIGTTENIPEELLRLALKASAATLKIIDYINSHRE